MIKKNYKAIIITITLIILLLPLKKINYHVEGKGTEQRTYSIIGLFIQDIKDGTVGTKY